MAIKTIIIDDEFLARENLKLLLNEFCEGVDIIDEADNIIDAKVKIETLNPDVIFLDIRMPSGAEGFDLLDSLETIDFKIVFVTAFKDYALKAFKANAIDYILKPIEIEELQKVVQKLQLGKEIDVVNFHSKEVIDNTLSSIEHKNVEKIVVSHSKGMTLINVSDIVRLQSNGNYTEVYLQNGTRMVDSKTLKVYQDILSEQQFMRIHNSHLINIASIVGYSSEDGHFALLDSGESISISRVNVSLFKEYLNQYKL